ncbi:hypothetical protein PENARI_c005G02365 [Penicillium arizonense]|uniref:Tubby C-terminal domain-containing protein n=1 Tax=Penicillium arizonense TaxID=1835702 RepID=A0A1F5LQ65_PENAI|nr:hypothetical protein PENARI_c005G02365 [Penicillium arizonense]OGE55079.1 hypothetical protein PENARI_c005G02365 [Penicillium arizonense]
MAPSVSNVKQPIAIRTEYTVSDPTSIRVKQHSLSLSGGEFTVSKWEPDQSSRLEDSPDILSVTGKVTSFHQRRHFRDPSGLPLFELSNKSLGSTRFVNLPGGGSGSEPIAIFAPRFDWHKDKFDLYVKNAVANGEETLLEVRGQDVYKLRTNVWANGALVMTIKRTDRYAPYIPLKRPEWQVDVGGGMDLSLASCIVVYMAETMYHPSMPSSHASAGQNDQGSSQEAELSEMGKME